ncbi:type VI secretion system-associated protein TagF [Tabrizicola sp.]|jgi:type VI secretion system protein ImpM|uniref:type VI secretion system-associated protein TagF n=1 Tax=Tabrizicola sp. TaxID=2005166 RepID=UPI001A5456DC|nr:type VI secretion system-associated protein TagF [Tabrizicola sp.]MBL9063815.1 type VI secretion system-associated protein TagF [Tabrizicola sp.]
MPDEVLTPDDDRRPVTGFFGKLPATGDFVWRGLPDAFRKHWDAWLTRHVAPLQREGRVFPTGGLRFCLPSGGRLAAGVILASEDSAGRLYPLSLLIIAEGDLTRSDIDDWCDAALALQPDAIAPEALWLALDALPTPNPDGPARGALQLWTRIHSPVAVDAEDPGAALRHMLSA